MRFSVFGASGLFWTLRKSLRDSTQAPTAATTTRATISDRNHPSKVPHPIEERLQKLVAKRDKATVSAGDVEDGIEFLETLKSRATRPEVREAIPIVNRQLKKAAGQTVEAILKKLPKSNPPKL
jgi:hypothetical protein